MGKRALVLGGGGTLGVAWETGLLAGLEGESVSLPSGSRIVLEGFAGAQFQLLVPPTACAPVSLLARISSLVS